MRIVHITPHIGGGVGSVLLGLFESMRLMSVQNSLYCLDYAESNFASITSISKKEDGLFFKPDIQIDLVNSLDGIDLVLLHYWNHPLLARFLSQNQLPKEKLVIWCHNSGLFEPQVLPKYLLNISNKVVFTNSCSYAAHNLQDLISVFPGRYGVVHSTRNLEDFIGIGSDRSYKKLKRNLLYTGTVSGSKMHPESAKIFAALSKQGFLIRVVGGPDHMRLANAVRSYGGEIEVFGEVKDVLPFFAEADIFIYPLRPDHYGTGEQVILEAMASGLPVIAFDNPAERAILEEGGGVLVSDAQDFVSSVNKLGSYPSVSFESMSLSAVNRIKLEFNIDRMTKNLIGNMSDTAQTIHRDVVDQRLTSFPQAGMDELNLYALHSFFDGEEMISNHVDNLASLEKSILEKIRPSLKSFDGIAKWCDSSKSTPFHYQRYFPDNIHLKSLCEKITAECGATNCM